MRYVALGDSYTIGTSVSVAERWPDQLAARITSLQLVANPAVNGFTSADLLRDELPVLDRLDVEFATVLIGVNDVVQGVGESAYARNANDILDELRSRLPADGILVVATPDYTVTPRGGDYGDPVTIRERIASVNRIMRGACAPRGVMFVPEIFGISQAAREDPSLVAGDGLHPSGAQYRLWVDVIAPAVEGLLRG